MTTERTRCGVPRIGHAGERAVVFGWVDRRRDHGSLTVIDLRDHTGVVQLVLSRDEAPEAHESARHVRNEWVVRAEGTLRERAEGARNPALATGDVEVAVTGLRVLSEARTPPFPVNEEAAIDERLRLEYRYLDLRRPRLQRNLRARAVFIAALRRAMDGMGFVEVETPMLIRATPEGARDYLVPSRTFPGRFFALPQSPQLYKQISMVAGFDRYYQIARCMRDEDLRADRQPEFTQLDVEMSFVDEEDVHAALEQAITAAWAEAGFRGRITAPFPRLTWQEAMDRYGVDKPDVRFGLELHDLTAVARESEFRVFRDAVARGGVVRGIAVPGGGDLSRARVEGELTEVVRTFRARGLAPLWWREHGGEGGSPAWEGVIAKFFSESQLAAIAERTGAAPGDCVLMVADRPGVVSASLGALRNHLGRARRLYDPDELAMIWVTEFPMFERDEDTGAISPVHHAFTAPHPDDVGLLESDPLRIRSRAYDIVLNGREIGSGSIRITDPVLQRRVFAAFGIGEEEARSKFGFLLEAFEHGVPPHGGFAAGVERLVMEGLGEDNIREVIAYPKTQQAQELMTDAPAPVDAAQLDELGIALRPAPSRPV